jgi:hypothetical protein
MDCSMAKTRKIGIGLAFVALFWAAAGPTRAEIAFEVDKQTLNDVLAEVTLDRVAVPITPKTVVTVMLEDLVVTGFDPTVGEHGNILTSVRLRVPEIGVNIPVKPRISLNVYEQSEGVMLELRFEEVRFGVPLVGEVDAAPLLPPMRYPTDNVFMLAGARGDVPIETRLKSVRMGREALRFVFEVEVLPPLPE